MLGLQTVVAGQALTGPCPRYEVAAVLEVDDCYFSPWAMNERGLITGSYFCGVGQDRPFLWDPYKQEVLAPDGIDQGRANGIDGPGRYAGYAEFPPFGRLGFVANGQSTESILFPIPDWAEWSEIQGINDAGDLVGFHVHAATGPRAFRIHEGVEEDLSQIVGTENSSAAVALNDRGDAAGYRWTGTAWEAFVISLDGALTLLGPIEGGTSSQARDINRHGQVVGDGLLTSTQRRAFLYDGARVRDLGALAGYTTSIAYAINDDGWIVGTSDGASGQAARAFVWAHDTMHDLAAMVAGDTPLQLGWARDISDGGMIVAGGGELLVLLRPVAPVRADLDCDQRVQWRDLLLLLSNWGTCDRGCRPDLDSDGQIAASDLLILMGAWSP